MNASARLLSALPIVLSLSISVSSQTATPPASSGWPPPGVHRYDEPGLRPPKLVHTVAPQYTSEAMRAGIVGSVCLEAVVDVNGHVAAVHVVRSLDVVNGLDEQGVRALEKWQFTPALKDGEAVPVLVSVKQAFALGKKKSRRDDCDH